MSGNRAQVLQDREETFAAIFAAMEQVQSFIHIEYYIFEEGDLSGQNLLTEEHFPSHESVGPTPVQISASGPDSDYASIHQTFVSKVIVVDDELASVGTANLDIRSFEQNFELNALMYDADVARQLKARFMDDRQDCRRLDLEAYRQRPRLDRVKESVFRVLSPLL